MVIQSDFKSEQFRKYNMNLIDYIPSNNSIQNISVRSNEQFVIQLDDPTFNDDIVCYMPRLAANISPFMEVSIAFHCYHHNAKCICILRLGPSFRRA